MWTVPAQSFWAPVRAKVMAAERDMPGRGKVRMGSDGLVSGHPDEWVDVLGREIVLWCGWHD